MSPSEPLISVLVPCYRGGTLIETCLTSLLRQDLQDPYEVIVIESTGDGSAERLAASFPRCRVIAPPRRTWPAEAQNIGLREARGAYVAITNHDCIVPEGWLRLLLERHTAGHYAAVGGAVDNGTPTSAVGTAAYWAEFNEYAPNRPAGPVASVPQCNVCFRRDVLIGPEPFPPVRFGAEELTFHYRLVSAGGVIFFDPAIVVVHVNRTRLREYLMHQHTLGVGSAMARRMVPLPGRVLIRHRWLIPALPLVRIARVAARAARQGPRPLARVLALLPLLLAGYAAWALGFWEGARLPLDETRGNTGNGGGGRSR